MAQEIEIEYKVLLTKTQYERLAKNLPFPAAMTQVNYYFETDQFDLKRNGSALRIRKKNGNYVLTLKEPHEEGILETHDKLTKAEFFQWIDGNPVAKPHTMEQLQKKEIEIEQLNYYGSLTTERKTFTEQNIAYFLDKSYYLEQTDYELEIEAPTQKQALNAFLNILETYNIEQKEPITKNERFFRLLVKTHDDFSDVQF